MMTRRKLGLVLEGGGAKGAYQFGALKAFRERGVVFHCVAGTSVGGLNAALWATERLTDGEKIWSNLRQSDIYPFRVHTYLGWAIAFLLVIFSGAVRYFQGGVNLSIPARWRWTLAATGLCIFSFALLLLPNLVSTEASIVLLPLLAALSVILLGLAAGQRYVGYFTSMFAIIAGLVGVVLLLALFGYVAFTYSEHIPRNVWLVIMVLFGFFFSTLAAAAAGFVIYVYRAFGRAVVAQNVLSSVPLRTELHRIMRDARFSIPTYVTVGEHRKLADPDNLYSVLHPTASIKAMLDPRYSESEAEEIHVPRAFVPHYLCLSAREDDDVVNALMATAALPLGLVPAVKLGDKRFVDGGIIDNRPLLPLVSMCECDEVVIVCLGPISSETLGGEKQRLQNLQRLIDLSEYDWEKLLAQAGGGLLTHNDPPVRCPYREPKKWPDIHVLAPSASLGGFVRGTMRFEAAYARRLMDLGYEDGERFLAVNKHLSAVQLPLI